MSLTRLLPLFMLVGSNCFMTYAWYGHLKDLRSQPLWIVILASWCVAFFEYCLQVPANRLGFAEGFTLSQLKVLQEVIAMGVFAAFAYLYMGQKLTWNFLWATICLIAAVFFIFRDAA